MSGKNALTEKMKKEHCMQLYVENEKLLNFLSQAHTSVFETFSFACLYLQLSAPNAFLINFIKY
jgi:hypothetical protein